MALQFGIKLTNYNIANLTSEYTIIKIWKDEEEQFTNDIPNLIEENKNDTANGGCNGSGTRDDDDVEKKKDIVHEEAVKTGDGGKEQI
ncbi:unnamed protein product [Linum trigynum]|uniref:Uncharacterized protein n=1 Tax=Linum trigynum TaxID=586398 RepID=A0AAV2FZU1_9ROSI